MIENWNGSIIISAAYLVARHKNKQYIIFSKILDNRLIAAEDYMPNIRNRDRD